MFRQQLFGCNVRKAYLSVADEGLGKLYRGVGPPLMQKSLSTALMFGSFHDLEQRLFTMNLGLGDTSVRMVRAALHFS